MNGYSIIIFDAPIGAVQFRFPRTKKRRIRNKWAKRTAQNFKPIFLTQYLVNDTAKTITCSSRLAEQLRREMSATFGP